MDYNDRGYEPTFSFDANHQLKLMSDLSKALDNLDVFTLRMLLRSRGLLDADAANQSTERNA